MATYAETIVADGAVAYWRLGEPSGTTAADSIGGNNGTLSGGVTLGVAGAVSGNTAMAFNGTTGKIVVPNGPFLAAGTGPLTLEAWIRTTTLQDTWFVDGKRDSTTLAGAGFLVSGSAPGGINFVTSDGTTNSFCGAEIAYADNAWHHLVGTVTRGASDISRLYVDGVKVAEITLPVTGASLTSARALVIGADEGPVTFANGQVDEVAFYKTALTLTQIAAHYSARYGAGTYPERVAADGASAYWRLGETAGTTAVDSIAGNNGTISGGVTLNQAGALTDGNGAMAFDGVSGRIAGTTALSLPNDWTLELWFRSTGAAGRQYPLFENDWQNQGMFTGIDSDSKIRFFATVGGPVSTARVVNDGVWHYLIVRYQRASPSLQILIDGVLDGQGTPTLSATFGTNPKIEIGFVSGVDAYFGVIDDVAIYPTALTPTQIAAHYAAATASAGTTTAFALTCSGDEGDDPMPLYNVWTPITPSDSADLARVTHGIWVGGAGTLAAVMQSNYMPVALTVPAGAWLPIAVRRVNSTNTTATGIVALYED